MIQTGTRWGQVHAWAFSYTFIYLCAPSHFSILGTLRMWKFMGTVLYTVGLKQTVCFTVYVEDTTVRFWSWVFVLSKVVELGECRGFVSGVR